VAHRGSTLSVISCGGAWRRNHSPDKKGGPEFLLECSSFWMNAGLFLGSLTG
jgi:hypothetical protein